VFGIRNFGVGNKADQHSAGPARVVTPFVACIAVVLTDAERPIQSDLVTVSPES